MAFPLASAELRNILAILTSLDRQEIQTAGYDMPDGSWHDFRENPARRFLRCNDACRDAITTAINKRATSVSPGANV